MRSDWIKRATWFGLSLGVPTMVALGTVACGDTPCEKLAEHCGNCIDATYRASCDEEVARNVYDVCDAQLSTFAAYCPAGQTVPTSTTTDTTTPTDTTTATTTTSTTTGTGAAGGNGGSAGSGGATGGSGGSGGGGGGTAGSGG